MDDNSGGIASHHQALDTNSSDGHHASAPGSSTELNAVGEELVKTSAKIESVELALSGQGVYLGITDKEKLINQLEVLQTKEAQLQKKELLLMAAAARNSTAVAAAAAAVGLIPGLAVTTTNPLPTPISLPALAPHLTHHPAIAVYGGAHNHSHQENSSDQSHANSNSYSNKDPNTGSGNNQNATENDHSNNNSGDGSNGNSSSNNNSIGNVDDDNNTESNTAAATTNINTNDHSNSHIDHNYSSNNNSTNDDPNKSRADTPTIHSALEESQSQPPPVPVTSQPSPPPTTQASSLQTQAPPAHLPTPVPPAPAPAPPPSLLQQHAPASLPPPVGLDPGHRQENIHEHGLGNMPETNGVQHQQQHQSQQHEGDISSGMMSTMVDDINIPVSSASNIGRQQQQQQQQQHIAGGGRIEGMHDENGGHAVMTGVPGVILDSGIISREMGMPGDGHNTGVPGSSGGGAGGGGLSVLGGVTLAPVKRRVNKNPEDNTGIEPESKRRSRLSSQCQHQGCTTARTFGREGDKHASYCAVHKHDGMVNIKGRRCNFPGCHHRPGFAMQGDKRGKYCATHREAGMIDVVSRKCQAEGGACDRQPVYGWPGERATRCGTHKLERTLTNLTTGATRVEKMYDVRGKRCQEPGCIRQPGFGDPLRDKGPIRCNEHKLEGMTNVRKRRALERAHKLHQQHPRHGLSPLEYHLHDPGMSHHGGGELQHHHAQGGSLGSDGLHSPSSYGAAAPAPSSYVHGGRHHSPPRQSLMRSTLSSTPPMAGGGYLPLSSEGGSAPALGASAAAVIGTANVSAGSSNGVVPAGHHAEYGSGAHGGSTDPTTGMPSEHHEHEHLQHGSHHSQAMSGVHNSHDLHAQHQHQQQQHHQGAVLAHHQQQQHQHTPTHYTADQSGHQLQHHHEQPPHQPSAEHTPTIVHHHPPPAHPHHSPTPQDPTSATVHEANQFYTEVAATTSALGVPTSPLDGVSRHEAGGEGVVRDAAGHIATGHGGHGGGSVNAEDEGATLEVLAQAAHSSSIAQQ